MDNSSCPAHTSVKGMQWSLGTLVLLRVLYSRLPLTSLGERLEKAMNETWWAFVCSLCGTLRMSGAEGTDLTMWRIWEFADIGQRIWEKIINSRKIMNAGLFCTLPWLLEGNVFTWMSLSTRSTLQVFDLGTENKWAFLALLFDMQGMMSILPQIDGRPYHPALDYFL